MEFVKDLWRGDVKLVFTYWVVGVIGNSLFAVPSVYLDTIGFVDEITEGKLIFLGGLFIVSILYAFFTIVCIWRSASKYKGRSVWAILAKAAVVFGTLRVMAELATVFGTA
jgi:hypothetical protein